MENQTMYFIIQNDGEPRRWQADYSIVRYNTLEDALEDCNLQEGNIIIPVTESEDELSAWIKRNSSVRSNTQGKTYLLEFNSVQYDESCDEWYVFPDVKCLE